MYEKVKFEKGQEISIWGFHAKIAGAAFFRIKKYYKDSKIRKTFFV
jgi:hypothetical protein